jgi:hypothetical protein
MALSAVRRDAAIFPVLEDKPTSRGYMDMSSSTHFAIGCGKV